MSSRGEHPVYAVRVCGEMVTRAYLNTYAYHIQRAGRPDSRPLGSRTATATEHPEYPRSTAPRTPRPCDPPDPRCVCGGCMRARRPDPRPPCGDPAPRCSRPADPP